MIKRIKSLISVKNLSASQFADLLGVQRSNISHILSGRNKPSLDFILKITELYPSISLEWLINGKGEMFNSKTEDKKNFAPQLNLSLGIDPQEAKEKPKPVIDKEFTIKEDAKDEVIKTIIPNGDIAKEESPGFYGSLAQKHGIIEQIVLLYSDGSFRNYNPGK